MSYAPKTRQNVFKMSDQRYRSNGLADDRFPQTPSNASSNKPQPNPAIVEEPFTATKKKCQGNNCPVVSPKMIEETQKPATLTAGMNQQPSEQVQRRNTLESSSHIVREVGHTVNKMLSYEEEALDRIEKITKDIERMYKEMEKVEKFEQMSEYKKFEEFFLQKNIELDNVDPKNNEQIREFRKAAVRYVQDCMYNLDQKEKMNVEL